MASINVLSMTQKSGAKLEKTSTSKGKNVSESPDNAVAVFAAMLGSSMNVPDSKGQNSSIASQEGQEMPSAINPVLSVPTQNGQGDILGFGNAALSFLTTLLQSELPAGKEANSGNDVSQGTKGLVNAKFAGTNAPSGAGDPQISALLNLISLASDGASMATGMTPQKPQGDTPGLVELDQYRQVIANLLQALSGEIVPTSSKGNALGPESAGAKNQSQDMAKIVQGWVTVPEEGTVKGQIPSSQQGIQALRDVLISAQSTGNSDLKEKATTLLAVLAPKSNPGAAEDKVPQGVMTSPKGVGDIGPLGNGVPKTVQGIAEDKAPQGVATPKGMDLHKGDFKEPIDPSVKTSQDQTSNTVVGLANQLVVPDVATGKTLASPVWEQIANVFHGQATSQNQELKELSIQLHPADLGKIQIGMRWENGQVHLSVQASEASTGQVLQSHLVELRQALTNQGVNCGMLQMGLGGKQQQTSRQNDPQRPSSHTEHRNEDEDLISAVNSTINPLIPAQEGINRINVMA